MFLGNFFQNCDRSMRKVNGRRNEFAIEARPFSGAFGDMNARAQLYLTFDRY